MEFLHKNQIEMFCFCLLQEIQEIDDTDENDEEGMLGLKVMVTYKVGGKY